MDLLLVNDTTIVSYLQVCDSLPGCDYDTIYIILNLLLLPPKQVSLATHHYLYNFIRRLIIILMSSGAVFSQYHGIWLFLMTLT